MREIVKLMAKDSITGCTEGDHPLWQPIGELRVIVVPYREGSHLSNFFTDH